MVPRPLAPERPRPRYLLGRHVRAQSSAAALADARLDELEREVLTAAATELDQVDLNAGGGPVLAGVHLDPPRPANVHMQVCTWLALAPSGRGHVGFGW